MFFINIHVSLLCWKECRSPSEVTAALKFEEYLLPIDLMMPLFIKIALQLD